MGISNEDLLFARFSECPIAPFEGAPYFMTLNSLKSHLNTCDALVHCNLEDGNSGYLVFTAPPTTYKILRTIPFVEPTNVGPTLTVLDLAPTEVVLLELV